MSEEKHLLEGKHLFVRSGDSDTPVQVPGLLPDDTDMVHAMAYLCGYVRGVHPEMERASVLTLELKDASPGGVKVE